MHRRTIQIIIVALIGFSAFWFVRAIQLQQRINDQLEKSVATEETHRAERDDRQEKFEDLEKRNRELERKAIAFKRTRDRLRALEDQPRDADSEDSPHIDESEISFANPPEPFLKLADLDEIGHLIFGAYPNSIFQLLSDDRVAALYFTDQEFSPSPEEFESCIELMNLNITVTEARRSAREQMLRTGRNLKSFDTRAARKAEIESNPDRRYDVLEEDGKYLLLDFTEFHFRHQADFDAIAELHEGLPRVSFSVGSGSTGD